MYSTKSYTFRVGVYHVGGGKEGHSGEGSSSTHPALLWGEIRFRVLGCLDSSDKSKRKNLSFANRKSVVMI